MRLLDLYSGAGGAAYGYMLAGFDVTGVDIAPQPRYRGDRFVQADALEYVAAHGHEFDCIHASPPCQAYSTFTPHRYRNNHPDLIEPTRKVLLATGKPFVIENVNGARHLLHNPMVLCGSMFGLSFWRHRRFEIHPWRLWLLPPCQHNFKPVMITDHGGPNAGGWGKPRKQTPIAIKRAAAEIDWMSESELSQAIPPAYTHWIGRHLLEALQ